MTKYMFGRAHDSYGNRILTCGHVPDSEGRCRKNGCRNGPLSIADKTRLSIECPRCGYVVCGCTARQLIFSKPLAIQPITECISEGRPLFEGMESRMERARAEREAIRARDAELFLTGRQAVERMLNEAFRAGKLKMQPPDPASQLIADLHGYGLKDFTVDSNIAMDCLVVRLKPDSGNEYDIPFEDWEGDRRYQGEVAAAWLRQEARKVAAKKPPKTVFDGQVISENRVRASGCFFVSSKPISKERIGEWVKFTVDNDTGIVEVL